jgi:hypothetical protein
MPLISLTVTVAVSVIVKRIWGLFLLTQDIGEKTSDSRAVVISVKKSVESID